MPTMDDYDADKPLKILMVGRSGSGKTGALASLAKDYRLIIADFDNGLTSLRAFSEQADRKNIHYKTFTDTMKKVGNKIVPKGTPKAFVNFLAALDPDWDGLGSIYDWGQDTVFVLDTLTHCSNAAMRLEVGLAGFAGKAPQIQHWGEAMRQVEEVLAMLYDDAVKCHVIVNTHLTYVEQEDGTVGYPSAIGSKLPPKVGSYFNTTLLMRSRGSGQNAKKTISTMPEGLIEAKFPYPNPPRELPQATGLRDIFNIVKGAK